MKTALFSLFLWIVTALPAFAQGPPHSDKLETDKGFMALKIKAKLSDVKSVLLKDTIARSTSFEPTDQILEWEQAVYLVDLKKPGYSEFCGRKIVRIEVYVSNLFNDFEGEVQTIDVVKIFVEKGDENAFGTMASVMFKNYGTATGGVDFPVEGFEQWTWWSEDVLMTATNWYGDENEPKMNYYKIEFSSAKGG